MSEHSHPNELPIIDVYPDAQDPTAYRPLPESSMFAYDLGDNAPQAHDSDTPPASATHHAADSGEPSRAIVPAGYFDRNNNTSQHTEAGTETPESRRRSFLAGAVGSIALAATGMRTRVQEALRTIAATPPAVLRAIHARHQARDARRNPRTHSGDPVREPDGLSAAKAADKYRAARHVDMAARLKKQYWDKKRQVFDYEAAGKDSQLVDLARGALQAGVFDAYAIAVVKAAKVKVGNEWKPRYTSEEITHFMYGHVYDAQRAAQDERKRRVAEDRQRLAADLGIPEEELDDYLYKQRRNGGRNGNGQRRNGGQQRGNNQRP